MKLFERPPVHPNAAQVIAAAPRPRHRKAIAARFLTQPITIREMEKARSRDLLKAEPTSCPSTRTKPSSPALGQLLSQPKRKHLFELRAIGFSFELVEY